MTNFSKALESGRGLDEMLLLSSASFYSGQMGSYRGEGLFLTKSVSFFLLSFASFEAHASGIMMKQAKERHRQ